VKNTLSALTCTNVVVLSIPTRYDLAHESIVNKEIKKANIDLMRICNRFRNVKVLDIGNLSRNYHTRHGQHLNNSGKKYVMHELSKIIICENRKNQPNIIVLGDPNQGN
jgi:hypothetical protein